MTGIFSKKNQLLIAALGISLLASGSLDAGQNKKSKKQKAKTDEVNASAEPDKVLYLRALEDMKHSRYTEGRLSLQTLINTYPDSEYLAKAKLAVADSYFKEGGTSNTTQSIQEYKDFITFFPFLDEAAYAQNQVGMAHYKMMEKSDRDRTQALEAEDEFQTFLLKYPQSPLAPQAEQHLRDVQEVLADGEFKIARFYYVKLDFRASAARLAEVTDRYPLYSQSDQALWMLGDVYSRAKQASRNEDDKNHWADLAAKCYDRILTDHPLSKYAPDSKSRLLAMGMPVPAADPNALARMQKEQEYIKEHHQNALLKMPLGMLKSNPDVSTASHSGPPNLNPPNDTLSATDILKPGAPGPSFGIAGGVVGGGGGTISGESVPVESTPSPAPSGSVPVTTTGVQIISTGNDAPPSASAPPANPPADPGPASNPPAANVPPTTATAPENGSGSPANGTTAPATTGGASAPATTPAATGGTTQGSSAQPAATNDPKQESTSKKKKGLRKLIPF